MKKSIMQKWVAALRSGDYKQGKDRLRNSKNQFCCLGVLCNLHAQEHPKFAATQTDPEFYDGLNAVLPDSVIEWAGFKGGNQNGIFQSYAMKKTSLTSINDSGTSFDKIADIIEENYKEL